MEEHILLEDLTLRRLGIPKVHHLVHELVYDHKVVADGLLFEFLEVLNKHGDETVEEEDDLRSVCVPLRQCEDCLKVVHHSI